MIGFLEGDIIASDARSVTIHTGGVGWRVYCGPSTLQTLLSRKAKVRVYTHLHVREDAQTLYGFRTHEELQFFESLLDVSGVGPRSAQQIIDSLTLDVGISAILQKNADIFKSVPGIGAKTAQRIIIDLEPKLKNLGYVTGDMSQFEQEEDVVTALMSLGYSKKEAKNVLEIIPKDIEGVAEQVQYALKHLGRK